MSNVRYPTYILAPNWECHPGEHIAIGNVIADPLVPQRALVKHDINDPLPTITDNNIDWKLSEETVRKSTLSVWAFTKAGSTS